MEQPLQNPPFTLSNIQFIPFTDIGEDMMRIEFEIESPEFVLKPSIIVSLFLDRLRSFLRAFNPPVYAHIMNISSAIPGIGPRDSKVIAVLEEENFDFQKHLTDWVSNVLPIREEYQRQVSMGFMTRSKKKEVQETFNKLSGHVGAIRESNLLRNKLFDHLHEVVNAAILDTCPNLLDSDSDVIIKLKNIIYKHLQPLAEDVTELSLDAK